LTKRKPSVILFLLTLRRQPGR